LLLLRIVMNPSLRSANGAHPEYMEDRTTGASGLQKDGLAAPGMDQQPVLYQVLDAADHA
jgi:hypothetical protein